MLNHTTNEQAEAGPPRGARRLKAAMDAPRAFRLWLALSLPGIVAIATAHEYGVLGILCWACLVPPMLAMRVRRPFFAAALMGVVVMLIHGIVLRAFAPLSPSAYVFIFVGAGVIYGATTYGVLKWLNGASWPAPAVGLLWLCVEKLMGVLGEAMANLSYTQWSSETVLLWSRLVGAEGISFLMWTTNALIAICIERWIWRRDRTGSLKVWSTSWVALLLGLCIYSWTWRPPADEEESLTVVVVPGHFTSAERLGTELNTQKRTRMISDYLSLTRAVPRDGAETRLILWPETACRAYLDEDVWARWAFTSSPLEEGDVILTGGLGLAQVTPRKEYNSAYLLQHDGSALQRYDKTRRIPFVEWQPLPMFGALLSPNMRRVDLVDGSGGGPIRVPGVEGSVGLNICYEEVFPATFREQVKAGAKYLVTLSNHAEMEYTPFPRRLERIAQFRAVENGRWLVRCCNRSESSIIDPRGRVVARAKYSAERPEQNATYMQRELQAVSQLTIYTSVTYVVFGQAAPLLLAAYILAVAVCKVRRRLADAP